MINFSATEEYKRSASQDRKALLRAAGKCICGPLVGFVSKRRGVLHGPVVSGGKCARCISVHARSA